MAGFFSALGAMALAPVLSCKRRFLRGQTPLCANTHVLTLRRYKHMGATAVRMRTRRSFSCPTDPSGRMASPGSPCSRHCSFS